MMDDKKRWRAGFAGSLFFHFLLCLAAAFIFKAGTGSLAAAPEIVEIDYMAGGGGGGGGGGENSPAGGAGNVGGVRAEITPPVQYAAAGDKIVSSEPAAAEAATAPLSAPSEPAAAAGSGIEPGTGPGSGGGSGGGHGGGIGSGIGPGTGRIKSPPRLLSNPKPEYPREARANGWSGTVFVRIVINTAGRVESASIVSSSGHFALDEAALAAVRRWRFQPGRNERDVPVNYAATFDITFNLE